MADISDQNSGNSQDQPGQKRRGKPFRPGQSGNPGGRPKGAANYRTRCREIAETLLEQLEEDVRSQVLTFGQRLAAFEVLSDRGGYLAGDDLAAAEAARWRVQLGVLALQVLTPEQRETLLKAWHAREREVLAELEEAA